jgi:hypothetical protein
MQERSRSPLAQNQVSLDSRILQNLKRSNT